jgi:hypothetical protein
MEVTNTYPLRVLPTNRLAVLIHFGCLPFGIRDKVNRVLSRLAPIQNFLDPLVLLVREDVHVLELPTLVYEVEELHDVVDPNGRHIVIRAVSIHNSDHFVIEVKGTIGLEGTHWRDTLDLGHEGVLVHLPIQEQVISLDIFVVVSTVIHRGLVPVFPRKFIVLLVFLVTGQVTLGWKKDT